MSEYIQLAKKLQTLYKLRLNPSVTSNVELGARLGVSKQAISRWCRGTITQPGDSIPNYQLIPLADIFGIEPSLFKLEFDQFEEVLEEKTNTKIAEGSRSRDLISISMLPNTGLNIFGREEELEFLNDCWQSNSIHVVQIVAFGGVGKSALVNKWLSKISQEHYRYAQRVYAWSFHWQAENSDVNATGDFFIEHALEWFGDDNPTSGTPWSKATRLARLVRQYRTLIVLDGLEVLQAPPGKDVGEIADPAIALFIKELATMNYGLCLITTRLQIKELETFEDGKCQRIELANLSSSACVEMLQSSGLHGNHAEFIQAGEHYSGHALSLSLLSGYLSIVHGGQISKYTNLNSLLDEQAHSSQVKQIMHSYREWFKGSAELEILYIISLFESSVSIVEMQEALNNCPDFGVLRNLSALDNADWSYALDKLESAHLIQVSRIGLKSVVDCHPIVRDYLIGFLQKNHPKEYLKSRNILFDIFKGKLSNHGYTECSDELLFKTVMLGSKAKRYRESFEIYSKYIKKGYVMLQEGSHFIDQACIRGFFKNEWTETVDSLEEEEEFYLKSCAASNLMTLGRINEAISPAMESINYFLERGNCKHACQSAGPLISAMIEAGRLGEAIELLDLLDDVVSQLGNPVITTLSLNFRAYTLYLSGDMQAANDLFAKAEIELGKCNSECEIVAPVISAYYGRFLVETGDFERAKSRMLEAVSWRENETWQMTFDTISIEASDILVLGLSYLGTGDIENARYYLNEQVELFRTANEWFYLPTGLNARARFLLSCGDFESAEIDLEESIDLSRRTGAKFGEWGAYLEFANLRLQQNRKAEGLDFLRMASGMEGMHQYKFAKNLFDKLAVELEMT